MISSPSGAGFEVVEPEEKGKSKQIGIKNMARTLNEVWRDKERGIAEYAIVVVAILLVVISTLGLIGDEGNSTVPNAASHLQQGD